MAAGARGRLLALSIAGSLAELYCFGLFDHDLWPPDEVRVASVDRQVSEGAWVVPTLNGMPFLEEPPLHAWCVALVYKAFGLEPSAIARLVSAFFGLGGLLLTGLIAAHLARRNGSASPPSGRSAGLLAALTLGLAVEYFLTSHRVIVDGALTFFTTASAYACLRGLTAEPGRARLGWMALGYALASAAFLAKGWIGLAVPGLAFLATAAALRDFKVIFRAHLWLAPVLFAVVAGPWSWLLYRQSGIEGLRAIFVDSILGRVLPAEAGTVGHFREAWFYLEHLPLGLLPGLLFVAGGALRRCVHRKVLEARERFAYDFAFYWLAFGLVMLSLASTKRPVYIVPFFPAAAVAGGLWLDAYLGKSLDGLYERAFQRVLAPLLACSGAAAPVAAYFLDGASMVWSAVSAAFGIAGAAWAWTRARRDERELLLAAWVCGLTLTVATAGIAIVPAFDAEKSLGRVSREIARLTPANREIRAFGADETTRGMIPLYTGRPLRVIPAVEDLERLVAKEGDVYVFTLDKRDKLSERADALKRLNPILLHEDVREGSRAYRLFQVQRAGAPPTAPRAR